MNYIGKLNFSEPFAKLHIKKMEFDDKNTIANINIMTNVANYAWNGPNLPENRYQPNNFY